MFRFSIAVALALTLGACTTVKHTPITQDSLNKLEGKSVAVSYTHLTLPTNREV